MSENKKPTLGMIESEEEARGKIIIGCFEDSMNNNSKINHSKKEREIIKQGLDNLLKNASLGVASESDIEAMEESIENIFSL